MRLFKDILIHAVRTSNGDTFDLRLLPEDARHLMLDLMVVLGEIPALPRNNDEDQGEN